MLQKPAAVDIVVVKDLKINIGGVRRSAPVVLELIRDAAGKRSQQFAFL
jgi:hypothetical protein